MPEEIGLAPLTSLNSYESMGEIRGVMVMFKQADYVMVTVSDMSRSIGFYKDVLGLLLKFESKEWSEFITGPTTIALHGGGKQGPAQMGPRGESYSGTCSV